MDYYELILNDPEFLDMFWRELGATDKYSVLEKSGWDLKAEYKKYEQEIKEGNDI